MGRFINPFTDVGFKRIFGQSVHKDLLIDFLNNLLEGEKQIKDISFLDKELLPEFQGDRGTIYDIYCTTESGEEFIVEMQNCEQAYIRERAIYYLCRAMSRQGERGANWKFNLKAVYGIFFLNFEMKDSEGNFVALTGNMVGALATDYILSQRKEQGRLPANGVVVKTIVSTEMITPICRAYGVGKIDVLTGFKYIGEQIKGFEETGSHTYLFGFEESYGCLIGTHARDKDAIVASMALCEMAAYYKEKGMTLYEALLKLYEKYGYYRDGVKSMTMKGLEGMARIQRIMKTFRENTPQELGGYKVVMAKDYQTQVFRNLETGEESGSPLPVSDVLHYTLEDGTWVCIRPSGTEPKLKFYIGVKADGLQAAQDKVDALDADIEAKVAEIA